MVKRLFVGLFLGAVVGAIVAAILVQGLGMTTFDASVLGPTSAYLAAAVTGVLTGLVAGKPIWSADGKIEAGLKAFFGALIALGGMFALRQWVHVSADLSALNAGTDELGHLPATALPMIAAVLAMFFEIDNSDAPKEKDGAAGKRPADSKVRVGAASSDEDLDDEDEAAPGPAAKKRG